MHTLGLFAALYAAHGAVSQMTGKLGDAMAVVNNPPGASYVAMFTEDSDNPVRGNVSAMSGPDGKGVTFNLVLTGLPMEGGPYSYHLHDQPVPMDGNCTATLAHLDPYQRGQASPCDTAMPATCEVGDLSGKHGKIDGPKVSKSFTEMYAALIPGIGAFFGNRSIVIHYANSTRLACANFTMEMISDPMEEMPGSKCGMGGHGM